MNRKNFASVSAVAALSCMMVLASGCASGSGQAGNMEHVINHQVTPAEMAAAQSQEPLVGDSARLYVNGMGCPLCASNLDRQLVRVKGVNSVVVDLGLGVSDVVFQPGAKRPSPHALGEAVKDAGFTLVKVEAR